MQLFDMLHHLTGMCIFTLTLGLIMAATQSSQASKIARAHVSCTHGGFRDGCSLKASDPLCAQGGQWCITESLRLEWAPGGVITLGLRGGAKQDEQVHTGWDLLVRLAAKLLLGIPDEPLKVDRQGALGLAALPHLSTQCQQIILHQNNRADVRVCSRLPSLCTARPSAGMQPPSEQGLAIVIKQ